MVDAPAASITPGVPGARRRLAVVLFNLGGPDGPEAVQPFLFNLFNDPAIIGLPWPIRPLLAWLISTRRRKEAGANYAVMGGASPLLAGTTAQAEALAAALNATLPGLETRSFMAMRYWKPFTTTATREVAAFAPDEIVLLPLYPQYSTTTTGSSVKAWRKAYNGSGRTHEVCCFFDAPGLASAHAHFIEETFKAAGAPKNLRLLFSAHGLPERVIERGDPYQRQVERTCEAIVHELSGAWDWSLCYQSRVGPLKWIGPTTREAITRAAADGQGGAGRARRFRLRTHRDPGRTRPRLCRTRPPEGLSGLSAGARGRRPARLHQQPGRHGGGGPVQDRLCAGGRRLRTVLGEVPLSSR